MEKTHSNTTIFSFDVFDTCISRTYERPKDLFFHLGYLIADESLDIDRRVDFAAKFQESRIIAERTANKKIGKHRNSSLDNIYCELIVSADCKKAKDDIKALEIQLEKSCSYAIRATKKIIENHRHNGNKIIFISDMYLSEKVIFELLKNSNIMNEHDQLYVSSESSYTKHAGDLYEIVKNTPEHHLKKICHYGDNYYADIKMAKKRGLDAVHINNTSIFKLEKTFKDSEFDITKSILNSIPKFLRLHKIHDLNHEEEKYFGMISPCLVAFTVWTLIRAKNMGIDTLYYVSRDAEIPFEIAKKISHIFGIEVKYLLGSRNAWLLPSITIEDEYWKAVAIPKNVTSSLNDVLERLQFTTNEITTIQRIFDIDLDHLHRKQDTCALEAITRKLLSDVEIRNTLNNRINEQRNLCLMYFEQEGLISSKKWAIVDSGWALNTQACLKRILKHSDYTHEIIGFYFGLSPKPLPKEAAGDAYSFTEDDHFYFYRAATLEHCIFPSDKNSLSHYKLSDNRIIPSFMDNSHSDTDTNFCKNLRSYVLSYTDEVSNRGIDFSFFYSEKIEILNNTRNFFSNPDRDVAKLLSLLSITIDARHSKNAKSSHFSPVSFFSFVKILISFVFNTKKDVYFWPEASAKLSNPVVSFLMTELLRIKNRYKGNNLIRDKKC